MGIQRAAARRPHRLYGRIRRNNRRAVKYFEGETEHLYHRSHASGTTQLRGHNNHLQQREQETPHARVSVGQTFGGAQRCAILDSA
jgi:hypothetical protein